MDIEDFEYLGDALREEMNKEMDEGLGPERRTSQRDAFLDWVSMRSESPAASEVGAPSYADASQDSTSAEHSKQTWRWRHRRIYALAAILVCVVLAGVLWANVELSTESRGRQSQGSSTDSEALSFVVVNGNKENAPQRRLVQGASAWLETTDTVDATRVEFSNGTEFMVERKSRVRIEGEPRKVRAVIESGRLQADVVSSPERVWLFDAGPYRVEVLGTRLEVGWREDGAELEVQVTEGRVRVSGGERLREGVIIAAGEHLKVRQHGFEVVSLRRPELEEHVEKMTGAEVEKSSLEAPFAEETGDTSGGKTRNATSKSAPPPIAFRKDTSRSHRTVPKRTVPKRTVPKRTVSKRAESRDWRSLAKAGEYEKAWEIVEPQFDEVIRDGEAWAVIAVADTARLAGEQAKSMQALRTLRSRFPGHQAASAAAFRLGKLERGADRAMEWFRMYLKETPQGAFAQESRGRILDLLAQSGHDARAQRAAQAYLKHHPHGPYARLAHSILSRKNDISAP